MIVTLDRLELERDKEILEVERNSYEEMLNYSDEDSDSSELYKSFIATYTRAIIRIENELRSYNEIFG